MGKSLKGTKTEKNLLAAFAGESQARNRYTYFAGVAKKSGYEESILLDPDGYVAEGTGENVFVVRNGILKTTPLTSILDGITRNSVMQLAGEKKIPVSEERFTRDDMYIADEIFLTGTAAEITPVRELDDRQIGDGKPGPITKSLQETFFRVVKGEDPSYAKWLTPIG